MLEGSRTARAVRRRRLSRQAPSAQRRCRSSTCLEGALDETQRDTVAHLICRHAQPTPTQDAGFAILLTVALETLAAIVSTATANKNAAFDFEIQQAIRPREVERPLSSRVEAVLRRRRRQFHRADLKLQIPLEAALH